MINHNEMSRQEIINLLKSSIVKVRFLKTNGEERTMIGTLLSVHVSDKLKNSNKKVSDSIVPLIDLTINEWRSFRIDSIKTLEKIA